MKPTDLLDSARDLVAVSRGRPREANLRRAVSTTYYALFHCIAQSCADLIVGGSGADRSQSAWRQTYRALNHAYVRNQCKKQHNVTKFPQAIQVFANLFVSMQKDRHDADYDPYATFFKSQVIANIAAADVAIRQFNQAPRKDRRAFAVYVLLTLRS